jgi:hypothetical protein
VLVQHGGRRQAHCRKIIRERSLEDKVCTEVTFWVRDASCGEESLSRKGIFSIFFQFFEVDSFSKKGTIPYYEGIFCPLVLGDSSFITKGKITWIIFHFLQCTISSFPYATKLLHKAFELVSHCSCWTI